MQITDKIRITNEHNMVLMSRYPDKYFDLAIVDPEYGMKIENSGTMFKKFGKTKGWDLNPPNEDYFNELFRVSKNQIIWGGNYFIEYLKNTKCMIFWDKKNGKNMMADGEFAWTSFNKHGKRFAMHHFEKGYGKKIHPTQKPVKLYCWTLDNFAKKGDKILDTNSGSGSLAVACHDYNFDLTACELDEEYFFDSIKRIKNHISQLKMF